MQHSSKYSRKNTKACCSQILCIDYIIAALSLLRNKTNEIRTISREVFRYLHCFFELIRFCWWVLCVQHVCAYHINTRFIDVHQLKTIDFCTQALIAFKWRRKKQLVRLWQLQFKQPRLNISNFLHASQMIFVLWYLLHLCLAASAFNLNK